MLYLLSYLPVKQDGFYSPEFWIAEPSLIILSEGEEIVNPLIYQANTSPIGA